MADKIKKFFQKKKVEAKFKLAGPGHKLTDNTLVYTSTVAATDSSSSKRSGLSRESQVAAEAALQRLSQRRENPAFNTSLAAIKAQVRKELETQHSDSESDVRVMESESRAGCSQRPDQQDVASQHDDVPRNMAVSGVYFRCPIIGNDILSRDEWKKKIKTFLYEQLEEERGLTACLIIQSCNSNREKVEACVETLCRYLENIVNNPDEEKYHKIRMTNRAFCDRVQPIEGAMELLHAAGFIQQVVTNADGVAEDYLVFDKEAVPSLESLSALIDALRSAEPIHLELDRNIQVLLPSQAATMRQLPDTFYALSPAEIKREQQLRTEAIEKSQMLRTKAMREKDELREMKKYKFAIIRVRFPDGILLQGTFSVYERYIDIHEFVQQNLEHSDLPFLLSGPTGHKLSIEEDANQTLIDLKLVPAVVLSFAWHPSIIEKINNSPNKDVYLKPEVMILVSEV